MDANKLREAANVRDVLPSGDELVTMTKEQLEALKSEIKGEFEARMIAAEDRVEKLRLKYESQEAESYVNRKGQDQRIVVHSRAMGPPDRMDLIANEHSDKLKGKVARFVTERPEITSLRRSQGYEPVRDEDGKEVRYMDGVLMAMPERKYQEEIAKPVRERRALNKKAAVERFKGTAQNYGFEVEGAGIQYDRGDET